MIKDAFAEATKVDKTAFWVVKFVFHASKLSIYKRWQYYSEYLWCNLEVNMLNRFTLFQRVCMCNVIICNLRKIRVFIGKWLLL